MTDIKEKKPVPILVTIKKIVKRARESRKNKNTK